MPGGPPLRFPFLKPSPLPPSVAYEETKTDRPLSFPVTRQIAAILERRFVDRDHFPE